MFKSSMINRTVGIAMVAACGAVTAFGAAETSGIFSDNMVLQRGKPLPVWGKADPGEKVTVSFAGQTLETTTDAHGDWTVTLKPLEVSKEGRPLTVNDRSFANVVVVSCEVVDDPVAVRYGYRANPMGAGNLYNKDGLPASPFRTDD